MTIFEYVKSISSIAVGTFFEHIQNITGTGATVYVDATSIDGSIVDEILDANLDIISVSADLEIVSYDVDVVQDDFTADLNTEIFNGN